MKFTKDKNFSFWVLTLAVILGLTLPVLVRDGMFMDGMLYVSVAHNLSEGIGTFWFPQFSRFNMAGLNSFHEQPPLCFGIESLFFKLLGGSMYVERFYSFATMCITAFLINLFWKEIFKNTDALRKVGWLPVLLWITMPVCYWSYCNNMCENTMGIFTLLAVFILYQNSGRDNSSILLLMVSAICIVLATLCKGFPGFFPLSFPILFWLVYRTPSFVRVIVHTLLLVLVAGLIYGILFSLPESGKSLRLYLFQRAFQRIADLPTTDSHFFILKNLFQNLLPQIVFILFILVIAGGKKIFLKNAIESKKIFLFLLIGFSGTLPLMLTLVQKGFYFVPALPFFAIGFAILIAPFLTVWIDKIKVSSLFFRSLRILPVVLLAGVLILTADNFGKTSHDKVALHDAYLIGKTIPRFSIISIPPALWNDWDLQCYLIRYFNISLDDNKKDMNYYFLSQKNFNPDTSYHEIFLSTEKYQLFSRQ